MTLQNAMDALIDALVETLVGALAEAAAAQDQTRERGARLCNEVAARELFGPELNDALSTIIGEVVKRGARRFESYRRHPRYSSDPLVAEIDNADANLSSAIMAFQAGGTSAPTLNVVLAVIRASMAAAAGGEMPMPGQKTRLALTRGPKQRRRAITAADVPRDLTQLIFEVARGDDVAGVIDRLHGLETTSINAGAIVTKVRVLLERDARSAQKLADTLRKAGVVEIAPAAVEAVSAEAGLPPPPRNAGVVASLRKPSLNTGRVPSLSRSLPSKRDPGGAPHTSGERR